MSNKGQTTTLAERVTIAEEYVPDKAAVRLPGRLSVHCRPCANRGKGICGKVERACPAKWVDPQLGRWQQRPQR